MMRYEDPPQHLEKCSKVPTYSLPLSYPPHTLRPRIPSGIKERLQKQETRGSSEALDLQERHQQELARSLSPQKPDNCQKNEARVSKEELCDQVANQGGVTTALFNKSCSSGDQKEESPANPGCSLEEPQQENTLVKPEENQQDNKLADAQGDGMVRFKPNIHICFSSKHRQN